MPSKYNVLPPYTQPSTSNNLARISSKPSGLYNASVYGNTHTCPSGSVLPSVNGGIIGISTKK